MKTLAHEWLDIEAEDFEVPQEAYDTLDSLLEKAKGIDVSKEPREILEAIGNLLQNEGFRYNKYNDWLSSRLIKKDSNNSNYHFH